jgi:putative membrane protein
MNESQFTSKHFIVFGVLLFVALIASINPLEYTSYGLHQIGTVLMLMVLIICFKKIGLSFNAFCLYILFLLIHILGAHYLYSYVPYSDWTMHLFGFNLDQSMGWTRNMYDRLVHISYGLFLYPFFYRLFQVWFPQISSTQRFWLVVQFVMATSLIYEWIEWLIAIGLSPEEAENYNGQQGDIWDAHKDMLVATIGSMITGAFMLYQDKKKALK